MSTIDYAAILTPTALLGGMGILFGLLLALASKKLGVESDPRAVQARDILPGANCGACSYPGCDGYAQAVASGEAAVNLCPVGGTEVARALGEIMGVEAGATERRVATVICRGADAQCGAHFNYEGALDCRAAAVTQEGAKACRFACLGLGTCARVCPFGAIDMAEGIARVDAEKCKGCAMCVAACPRGVLRMEDEGRRVVLKCRATERGKAVRDACHAGCLACGKCERVCKFGAIMMLNNLPVLNKDVCVGCLQCALGCPTGAMWGDIGHMSYARVSHDSCDGCGKCDQACKFSAINVGENGKRSVREDACAGCSQCVSACPPRAIRMIRRGA